MQPCIVRRLGRVAYREAMALQRELVRRRLDDAIPDTLLLLEHPPVITLGKMARPEHVLGHDIETVQTDRGGDVTYHGPGQLVGYPIVRLERPDVKRYLHQLEEVMIRVAADYGIQATRCAGMTGVWVGDAKIGAIGVRVQQWVTSHGFALNVNTDLRHFERIVPCGLKGKRVASMASLLGRQVDFDEIQLTITRAFGDVFEREPRFAEALARA
ncbi:MAG: lipoyl(octanoyl) transferase LipB [Planctomycetes bacterium]|nr:lipoyl(octanoyl) transferase LipB [Planctomycetota bacterium]